MATGISTYASNKVIDWIFGTSSMPSTTTAYVSLHSGDPGYTGANEITAGGFSYSRKSVTAGAASGRATDNTNTLTWTNMPAVTVSYVGVWDASSSGNFLWGGQLASSKTVNAGDTLEIAIGDLDATMP